MLGSQQSALVFAAAVALGEICRHGALPVSDSSDTDDVVTKHSIVQGLLKRLQADREPMRVSELERTNSTSVKYM